MARFVDAPGARTHSAAQLSRLIGSMRAEEPKRGNKPANRSTYCRGQCRLGLKAHARTAFLTISRLAIDTATDCGLWRW